MNLFIKNSMGDTYFYVFMKRHNILALFIEACADMCILISLFAHVAHEAHEAHIFQIHDT